MTSTATRPRSRAARRQLHVTAPALTAILLGALALRLWGLRSGLPFSYNADEDGHFVPVAIGFFGHGWNPRYFLNPPGYTELIHVAFALWFGGGAGVARTFAHDPGAVFAVARVVAALLGTAAVGLAYLFGARLLDRTVGLLAAAISAVAFLPVFYGHFALNDAPTLAPVTLSLLGTALVLRRGRTADLLIAGAGAGLAAGTKYTAVIALLPLLTAIAVRAHGAGRGPAGAVRPAAVALAAALAGFLVANPYALLDFSTFRAGVATQQELAGGGQLSKLGLTQRNGIVYYLWSLTWGIGWVPALAAAGGAVRLVLRDRALALVLLPAPLLYIVYMGLQDRYFGRWVLPVTPIVVVLAASFAVACVRAVGRRAPAAAAPAGLVLTLALLGQGLVTSLHVDVALARTDTRDTARDWMLANVPAGAGVVVEPVVPRSWTQDPNRAAPALPGGGRWRLWDTSRADVDDEARPLPGGRTRYVLVDRYERTLRPALIDEYVARGYCWVMTASMQRDRAYAQPGEVPRAIAYYRALARRGERVFSVSPYRDGAGTPPFNFDWSFDYYPFAYARPGPAIAVYRLHGGRCG